MASHVVMRYIAISEELQSQLIILTPPSRDKESALSRQLANMITLAGRARPSKLLSVLPNNLAESDLQQYRYLAIGSISSVVVGCVLGHVEIAPLDITPAHLHAQRQRVYTFTAYERKGYAQTMISLVLAAEKLNGAVYTAVEIEDVALKAWQKGAEAYGKALEKHKGAPDPATGERYHGSYLVRH